MAFILCLSLRKKRLEMTTKSARCFGESQRNPSFSSRTDFNRPPKDIKRHLWWEAFLNSYKESLQGNLQNWKKSDRPKSRESEFFLWINGLGMFQVGVSKKEQFAILEVFEELSLGSHCSTGWAWVPPKSSETPTWLWVKIEVPYWTPKKPFQKTTVGWLSHPKRRGLSFRPHKNVSILSFIFLKMPSSGWKMQLRLLWRGWEGWLLKPFLYISFFFCGSVLFFSVQIQAVGGFVEERWRKGCFIYWTPGAEEARTLLKIYMEDNCIPIDWIDFVQSYILLIHVVQHFYRSVSLRGPSHQDIQCHSIALFQKNSQRNSFRDQTRSNCNLEGQLILPYSQEDEVTIFLPDFNASISSKRILTLRSKEAKKHRSIRIPKRPLAQQRLCRSLFEPSGFDHPKRSKKDTSHWEAES